MAPDTNLTPLRPAPERQRGLEVKTKTMNRSKLDAIAARSAENLVALFAEHGDAISQGIAAAAEEAEAQGKESIVVNLSHTLRLDLGKDSQTDKLSWSVKHTVEACGQIPDPSQPELPGTTMTIVTGARTVTVTPEQAKEAVKRMDKEIAKEKEGATK